MHETGMVSQQGVGAIAGQVDLGLLLMLTARPLPESFNIVNVTPCCMHHTSCEEAEIEILSEYCHEWKSSGATPLPPKA